MTIEFKKEIITSRMLDASLGFQERTAKVEIRFDPLTGRAAALMDGPMRKYAIAKSDLSELVKRSLDMGCPFCPPNLEKVTPKYPPDIFPDGRLRYEEICIFPNTAAFAPYTAVASLGSQHFIEVGEYSEELLLHGLQACQLFLKRVAAYDRKIKYCTINWNCFPPAGGSIIHPHFQPIADYSPVNHFRKLLDASRNHERRNSGAYWPQLVATEKAAGERFLGMTGEISWLLSFAPWTRWWDAMAIFPGPLGIGDVSAQNWLDFVQGLRRVLRFVAGQNFYSFNMTLFFTIDKKSYFWPHAHFTPRYVLPPLGMSDASYIELFHGQVTSAFPPEDICAQMRPYFET